MPTSASWISPQMPLDADDPDVPEDAKQFTYGDWFARRVGQLAAVSGMQGFAGADFFDQVPHARLDEIDFNPRIIRDFERWSGIDVQGDTPQQWSADIKANHFPRWLDYWGHAFADWYAKLLDEVESKTGRSSLMRLQKHTFNHDKRLTG